MKGFSRYSGIEFRPRSLSDLIARVLIDSRRFGASSVDCRSNGLFARQTVLPIFSILTLYRSYRNRARWAETSLSPAGRCLVGDPDHIEVTSSLVTRRFELGFSFPLCLEVSLHFAFSLTLLISLCVGPFSFIPTFFLSGQAPNPLSDLSSHNRPAAAQRTEISPPVERPEVREEDTNPAGSFARCGQGERA